MRLNREQIKQLHAALKRAFPTRSSLHILIRMELDEELEEIAGNENHVDTVFRIITWAETTGRVEELVHRALESNPGNPDMRQLVATHFPSLAAPETEGKTQTTQASQKTETATKKRSAPRSRATQGTVVSSPSVKPVDVIPPNVRLEVNPKDNAELIWIPAGAFLMGDGKLTVILPEYAIYKYPVTVAMYRNYDSAADNPNQGKYDWIGRKPRWGWQDDHPMVNVTWHEAEAYSNWAAVSLPTEAEWEKAARGTDGREYPWEGGWDAGKCHCSKKTWGDAGGTAPVGLYEAGISVYGVLDMAGNVWEWCADRYGSGINSRVLRGGSWDASVPDFFRCTYRSWNLPLLRLYGDGFRCISRSDSL